MPVPKKNKLWKEMYLYAQDKELDILNNKDFEGMFQDLIVEHLETGIDIITLLQHKDNNLNSTSKTKEDIDKAVEILVQELAQKVNADENVEKSPTLEKRPYKKGKK